MQAQLVAYINQRLEDESFINAYKNEPRFFTRKSLLNFKSLFLFIANIRTSSSQHELDKFFQTISSEELSDSVITDTAFFHARKKLNYQAFSVMNREVADLFYAQNDYKTWHGHRLFAVDGTTLQLPEEPRLADYFERNNSNDPTSTVVARVSTLYDVCNNLIYDASIGHYRTPEIEGAFQHIQFLKPDDLILYDRNYPSKELFARHAKLKLQFCGRIRNQGWKMVQSFLETGFDEQIVDLTNDRDLQKHLHQLEIPDEIIKVRLLRIDIGQDEPEILVTSLLDTQKYPYDQFKQLYHLRWEIETGYRYIKESCAIENVSSKTVHGVKQDFFATIFTHTLTAIMTHDANQKIQEQTAGRKYKYKLNWVNALAKLRTYAPLLFFREKIEYLLARLLNLFTQKPSPERPDRTYERRHKRNRVRSKMTYKTT